MYFKAQSLLAKVTAKGVITPFEAINLQYLCKQQMLNEARNKSNINNEYFEIMDMKSPLSDLTLILQTSGHVGLHNLYAWLYDLLFDFDLTSSDFGHKGLAFIYELNRIYEQYTSKFKTSKELQTASYKELQDQKIFSMICQQDKTYSDLTVEFIKTYRNLVSVIDNVLTLNYYLQELIELSDLDCLKHFTSWFVKDVDPPKNMFLITAFDLPKMFYKELLGVMLEDNHHNFIQYLRYKAFYKGAKLPEDFEKSSLAYVKEVITQHIKAVGIENMSVQEASIKTEKSE